MKKERERRVEEGYRRRARRGVRSGLVGAFNYLRRAKRRRKGKKREVGNEVEKRVSGEKKKGREEKRGGERIKR